MWYLYSVEYYLARKEGILPFATAWMDPQGIALSEIGQRKKYCTVSLMWNLKSQTHTKSRTMVSSGQQVEEMERCWSNGANFQLQDKFGGSNTAQ